MDTLNKIIELDYNSRTKEEIKQINRIKKIIERDDIMPCVIKTGWHK